MTAIANAVAEQFGLTTRQLGPGFFAEIGGVDLSQHLSAATISEIREALNRHGVLLFRGQRLSEADQVRFSRQFGELMGHVLTQYLHPRHPEILVVSNIQENGRNIGLADAGHHWHADLTYLAEPSLGSLLYAREVPETGGDTLFADLAGAYDALPQEVKDRIESLQAVHLYLDTYERLRKENSQRPELTEEQWASLPDVLHPVVAIHPESGRRTLYVSEGFTSHIPGIPREESDELLSYLFAHSTSDAFLYRHRWEKGDLLFWDNRRTVHKAAGGYALPQRRLMHRTTIKGTRPTGP
ncbi:TauD/TfdA family dioxygenase [Telmatospirillum sp. J64-1]|uniref:TauD/TfdA dioxygenase family protein n=1 Tax=Telmatospirillum sp. J64-1 TaxID=2502183 RepID=UPI00115D4CF3|nr:TauD/TfdA family dioxygenase [Telmatospirillum sp. J64-1]